MVTLIIFFVSYGLFLFLPKYKTVTAVAAVAVLALIEVVEVKHIGSDVRWNVLALLLGTSMLTYLFSHSKVPAFIVEWLVDRAKNIQRALMFVFAMGAVLSIFIENIAVVFLMVPTLISLCSKYKISPVTPVLFLLMIINLEGTATLISDPPSMLLGSYLGIKFEDFFVYEHEPSIFFIVQAAVLCVFVLAYFMFRRYKTPVVLVPEEKVRSWVPTILLAFFVLILSFGHIWDPETRWLGGSVAMLLGIVGMIWHHCKARWEPTFKIVKALEWSTLLFLAALCILVGALHTAGWIDEVSIFILNHIPRDPFVMYLFIFLISMILSAFIDNTPYLIAVLTIVQNISNVTSFSLPLLAFGLLISTTFGSNLTPIGSSSNIVALSFLEKVGLAPTFYRYVKLSLLFTTVAIIPAMTLLWYIWGR